MDKLTEIINWKRKEIEPLIRPVKDAELSYFGNQARQGPTFSEALKGSSGLAVIAEIKRRSPSAGQIADLPAATEQARKYTNANVNAMSVLTDQNFRSRVDRIKRTPLYLDLRLLLRLTFKTVGSVLGSSPEQSRGI